MAGPRQALRVAAYGVITDSAGRILLTRLSELTQAPGWWTLPGGGIDHGEHPRDAAIREVAEETGLVVEIGPVLDVLSFHEQPSNANPRLDDFHALQIVYRAYLVDEAAELVVEQDGTTDLAQWFPIDELEGVTLTELAAAGIKHAKRSGDPQPATR